MADAYLFIVTFQPIIPFLNSNVTQQLKLMFTSKFIESMTVIITFKPKTKMQTFSFSNILIIFKFIQTTSSLLIMCIQQLS